MDYFTGIGNRNTPQNYLVLLEEISKYIVQNYALRLRSGHAVGADRACERGANGYADIYLPWSDYGVKPYKNDLGMSVLGTSYVVTDDPYRQSLAVLMCNLVNRKPYSEMSSGIKKLMYRNVFQIVGHHQLIKLTKFVLCYRSDKGGTDYALALAGYLQIPVINILHKNKHTVLNKIKEII